MAAEVSSHTIVGGGCFSPFASGTRCNISVRIAILRAAFDLQWSVSNEQLNVVIPVCLPLGEMHEPVPSQRTLVYNMALRGFRHTLRLSPYNSGSISILSSAPVGDFRFAGRMEPSDGEPSASVDC